MNRKINIFIMLIIIISIMATAVGCGNQTEDSNTDKTDEDVVENQDNENEENKDNNEENLENNEDEDKQNTENENVTAKIEMPDIELENKEIIHYYWKDIDTRRSKEGEPPTAVDLFEQEYGGKITTIIGTHSDYWEKLGALVSSGDSPDFIYMPDWNWYPQAIIKNIVMPAEKYIDFNKPLWKDVEKANDEYRWEGKIYTPIVNEYVWEWLYYNQSLFDNYGLDTPRDYFERDEWTWETLKNLAVELTDDTDNDGKIDQWGFSSVYVPFVYVCGKPVVESTDDGYFKHNLKDSKIAMAMDFLHELGTGGLNVYGGYTGAMQQGKLGMYAFVPWGHAEDFRQAWDRGEIEIAPIPKPTADAEYVIPVKAQAHGIGNGCKNPKGAALMIELYRYESSEAYREKYDNVNTLLAGSCKIDSDADLLSSPMLTEDQIAYHKKLMELPKVSTAWETWYQERDLASGRVLGGEPWSKVVEELYPGKQKLLESYFKSGDKSDEADSAVEE